MGDIVKKQAQEVAAAPQSIMTVAEIKGNIQLIQQAMKDVMLKGSHYDVIPGTKKNTLLKPGAEKILTMFRVGTEIKIEDLGDGYDFRYRITVKGFHINTGNVIGYGVGECSTSEKKYAWRRAICQEEYDETPETRRRKFWQSKKDNRGWKTKEVECIIQVRQDPADLANTILKMAKKRALVDLCLTSTACSDIFEQDLDEEHLREAAQNAQQQPTQQYQQPQAQAQQQTQPPQQHRYGADDLPQGQQQPAQGQVKPISEAQSKRLFALMKKAGKTKETVDHYLVTQYGIHSFTDIPWNVYETICNWVQAPQTQPTVTPQQDMQF